MTLWLSTSFEIRFRLIDGMTVRLVLSGDRADHAVPNPRPETLLAFEPIWSRLAEQTRLVALDLPGCGHSRRSGSLLSRRVMGEFAVQAADVLWFDNPCTAEEAQMWPAMDDTSDPAHQANALFASALQRSDEPSASQIRQAVTAAIAAFGCPGCAGRAAQEFGDHPETAAIRMRWARAAARTAFADSPAEALI